MPVQQHHVEKLKQIIMEDTGDVISDAEAWEIATKLYNLFRLLIHGSE